MHQKIKTTIAAVVVGVALLATSGAGTAAVIDARPKLTCC